MSRIRVEDTRTDPAVQSLKVGDVLMMGNGGRCMIVRLPNGFFGSLDLGNCSIHYNAKTIDELIDMYRNARSAPHRAVPSEQVMIALTGSTSLEIQIKYRGDSINENCKI